MQIFKYEGGRDHEVLLLIEKTLIASGYDVPFDYIHWAAWLKDVNTRPLDFVVILAEQEGQLVGILVGQIYHGHILLQNSYFAMELFWYVDPDSRGKGSFKMVEMYEDWAKEVGASHITMSLLQNEHKDKLDRIYRLKGYKPMETQYMKAIENA